jgi:hypothetical protein
MYRIVHALLALPFVLPWICAGGVLLAQPPRAPATFGARLRPLPPLLYEHLPQLKKGKGVAVEVVQPNSFAERTGLQVHDILLNYDGTELTDSKQLHDLLRGWTPENRGSLVLLRHGKEMKLDVVLTPAPPGQATMVAAIKRGGPPAINLTAVPKQNDKYQVTFEYYADADSGKLRQLTCTGSLPELEQQVQKLPERLQDLARVALQRLRAVNRP